MRWKALAVVDNEHELPESELLAVIDAELGRRDGCFVDEADASRDAMIVEWVGS